MLLLINPVSNVTTLWHFFLNVNLVLNNSLKFMFFRYLNKTFYQGKQSDCKSSGYFQV